jgi:AcrR family transcriptional regulator
MKSAEGRMGVRPYRMRARAEAAERRAARILDAAVQLWRERWYDEMTLEDLVERSGVSASTILRRFGSKEGILAAVIAADPLGVVRGRDRIAVGDVDAAVRELVDHYEQVGDAVIRDLALEERIPAIGQAVRRGRALHRAALHRVLSQPSFRAAAEQLRQAIRADLAADRAVAELEALADASAPLQPAHDPNRSR